MVSLNPLTTPYPLAAIPNEEIRPPPTQALPLELTKHILSFLPREDLFKVSLASPILNISSTAILKREQVQKTKSFIRFIISNLSEHYADKKSSLLDLIKNIDHLKSEIFSLSDTHSSLLNLREKVALILKDVGVNKLQKLKKLSAIEDKSKPFEELFRLIKIHKKISNPKKIKNNRGKGFALKEIVETLIKIHSFDTALEVALKIPSLQVKAFCITDINEARHASSIRF